MNEKTPQIKLSFSLRILFLFSLMLVCLYLVAVVGIVLSKKFGATNAVLNAQVALQNILVFTFPAIVCAYFTNNRPFGFLKLNAMPRLKPLLFVLLAYFVAIPAMNFIVDWNSNVHLPESMGAIETLLRKYEDEAQALTDQLTSGVSLTQLLALVFTIGLLTGFGEEVFFRGALTQMMIHKPMNKHMAIWIGAFVFSLMHFQFFGFVPRMLLGAFFGYLLVWSDCLWLPIFAHMLNNSFAIISKYLLEQKIVQCSFDEIGTPDFMLWTAPVSAILFALLLYKRNLFKLSNTIND